MYLSAFLKIFPSRPTDDFFVSPIFKLGNGVEHLSLDFSLFFPHFGNPFYKIRRVFLFPNININSLIPLPYFYIRYYNHLCREILLSTNFCLILSIF